jgi:hypothetical protein
MGVDDLPSTPAVQLAIAELERYAEGELNASITVIALSISPSCFTGTPAPTFQWIAKCSPLQPCCMTSACIRRPLRRLTATTSPCGVRGSRGESGKRRVGRHTASTWPPNHHDQRERAGIETLGCRSPFARLAPLVDAVGQCWKLHPDDARSIFSAWPASDLDRMIVRAVADDAARHPGSCFALFTPLFPYLVMNCRSRWQRRLSTYR